LKKADELVGNFALVDSVREWHNGRFYCPIHSNRVEIMKGQTPLIKLINIHIKDLPVVNSPKKKLNGKPSVAGAPSAVVATPRSASLLLGLARAN
jgi:hypothetical protein